MHDDPQFPGPGDSSSGIHRIIDSTPDSEQLTPGGAESSVERGSTSMDRANSAPTPLPTDAAPAGEPVVFPNWTDLTRTNPRTVDPSAETVAEDFPPFPLAAITSERTPMSSARGRPEAPLNRRSLLLIGLISYASAATLALLYLLIALSRGRPHALESLPDVPPLDVQHGEVMKLAPADAEVPPGHRLSLGESRRFGNILVEPLRVAIEPIEFAHFSGRTAIEKPPTPPVLKLWLRFTNVSDDQTIPPLDPDLVFRRAMLDHGPRANQFVRRVADENSDGPQVLLYDHPIASEWDLLDQHLGVRLAPGESLETYLPSGEEGAALTGLLVWRVHFRKGYSPGGHGVTTLVDVEFDAPTGPKSDPAAG
jgi:hypothetical protein